MYIYQKKQNVKLYCFSVLVKKHGNRMRLLRKIAEKGELTTNILPNLFLEYQFYYLTGISIQTFVYNFEWHWRLYRVKTRSQWESLLRFVHSFDITDNHFNIGYVGDTFVGKAKWVSGKLNH